MTHTETPEYKAAINGITKWASLKGWKSDPRFLRSLTGALKKFCIDAESVTACIEYFYENSKFVPAPSEIKDIARSKAWGLVGQERLRRLKARAALTCQNCQGQGSYLGTVKRPKPKWQEGYQDGDTIEVQAVIWCSCDYGRARAKANAAAMRRDNQPKHQDSQPASVGEIVN